MVIRVRHDAPPDPDAERAALSVHRLRPGLLHQVPLFPLHLAARCPRRSADRQLGHPGQRVLKFGTYGLLRYAIRSFPSAVATSARRSLQCAGDRRYLWFARRVRPAGHQEAHRLLLGGPHGLLVVGLFMLNPRAVISSCHLSDAGARHLDRRPVPLRGRHL